MYVCIYISTDINSASKRMFLLMMAPVYLVSLCDSFLIFEVTSCDTPTVFHPLFLPLSLPGSLMSKGLVIYRVTSWWRGMLAIGKETLRGQPIRKHSCVPYSRLAPFWKCRWDLTACTQHDRLKYCINTYILKYCIHNTYILYVLCSSSGSSVEIGVQELYMRKIKMLTEALHYAHL